MKKITLSRVGHSLAIVLVLLSLLVMVYFGCQFYVEPEPEIATAFTGAGAVLAAAVSALVSFRTVAIVEESQRPYPYPYIDIKSRYGLSLIKIKNAGGSAAHGVYVDWGGCTPLLHQGPNSEALPIHIACDKDHAISILMPGDEQSAILGVHHWVAERLKKDKPTLRGHVISHDVKGNICRTPFFIDTSFYEWALADETELLKAQRAMTELPRALTKINKSLSKIKNTLERNETTQ